MLDLILLQNSATTKLVGSKFLDSFTTDSIMDAGNLAILSVTGGIAVSLLGLYILISTAINFFTETIKGNPWMFNWGELIRTFFYAGLVFAYVPVIGSVSLIITGINNATMVSESDFVKYRLVVEKIILNDKNLEIKLDTTFRSDNGTEPGDAAGSQDNMETNNADGTKTRRNYRSPNTGATEDSDSVFNFWDNMQLGASAIVLNVLQVLALSIKGIMMVIMKVVFNALFLVGPFAIAFSILPFFRSQFESWFSTFCTAGLSVATMHIIDHVFTYSQAALLQARSMGGVKSYAMDGGNLNVSETVAFSMAWGILYLLSPWLTSKWCGSGDAGKMLGTAAEAGAKMLGAAAAAKGLIPGDKKSTPSTPTPGGGGSTETLAGAGNDAIFKNGNQ